MPELSPEIQRDLARTLVRCRRRWQQPRLTGVSVRFSARLTRSLGRSQFKHGQVVLAQRLLAPSLRSLLHEVLCHELAHLALYHAHTPKPWTHSPAWQHLMVQAGFVPRVQIPLPAEARRPRTAGPARARRYEHRCPVCQMVRLARCRVPRWRCAACVAAGLSGELLITRRC